jgi:hypothetical protein
MLCIQPVLRYKALKAIIIIIIIIIIRIIIIIKFVTL